MSNRAKIHYRSLEQMYLSAAINELYKPSIEICKSEAIISMPVQEQFFHAAGSLHGSAYFKCLDDAAYFAAMSREFNEFLLTASFNTYITRPVAKGQLRSEGRIISFGKKLIIAEAIAYDERGREVARGSGTFMPSGIPLDEKVGYGNLKS